MTVHLGGLFASVPQIHPRPDFWLGGGCDLAERRGEWGFSLTSEGGKGILCELERLGRVGIDRRSRTGNKGLIQG